MADIHFHIWLYKRDTDGIIRSMERAEEQFDIRRKANYGLEVFRRQRSLGVCLRKNVLNDNRLHES